MRRNETTKETGEDTKKETDSVTTKYTSVSSRRLGVLLKPEWSQKRHTIPRSCMVAVVVVVLLSSSSSSDKNIWCMGVSCHGAETTTTILRPKTCRKLRWCRRVTTSRTRPERRTQVIRTGRVQPSHISETTLQRRWVVRTNSGRLI